MSIACFWVVELYGCDQEKINSLSEVESSLTKAAEYCNATIVNKIFHKFSPQGISGVIVIAESHISIHTWPEYNYAACDIFTCNNTLSVDDAISFLKETFRAKECKIIKIERGEEELVKKYQNIINIKDVKYRV